MSPEQGRLVYDHVALDAARATVLELGTAHGVGAAYLAARAGRQRPRRADDRRLRRREPTTRRPRRCWRGRAWRSGSTVVREFSSYTWWLKEQVQARSDARGNVEPRLRLRLPRRREELDDRRPRGGADREAAAAGRLAADGRPRTGPTPQDPGREATDGIVHRELSEPERTEPHLRAVFDLIVAQHPSFTELKVQDEWWGWARKAPGEPRRYTLETSRPLGALVGGRGPARGPAGASGHEEAVAEVELLALEQVRVLLGPGAGLEVRPQPLEARRELLGRAARPAPRSRRGPRGRGRRPAGASTRRRSRPGSRAGPGRRSRCVAPQRAGLVGEATGTCSPRRATNGKYSA